MSEGRDLPDVTNSLEWNLVARRSLQASQTAAIIRVPTQTFLISTNVVAVGVRNSSAPASWYLGAWANCYANFTPSSQSDFVAVVKVHEQRLKLNNLNLVVVPKVTIGFILEVVFPKWFLAMDVEVWRYDGADRTLFDVVS